MRVILLVLCWACAALGQSKQERGQRIVEEALAAMGP